MPNKPKRDPREALGVKLRGVEDPSQSEPSVASMPKSEDTSDEEPEQISPAENKQEQDIAPKSPVDKDEWVPLGTEIPKSLRQRLDDYWSRPGAIKPKKLAIAKALEMFLDKAEQIQRDYEKAMSDMGMR